MIRNRLDAEVDAIYAWFAPEGTNVAQTEEVLPGVMLDRNAHGNAIGIEVLGVRAGLVGDGAAHARARQAAE